MTRLKDWFDKKSKTIIRFQYAMNFKTSVVGEGGGKCVNNYITFPS